MKYLYIFLLLLAGHCSLAQEKPDEVLEAQLESAAENNEDITEDDSYWQSAMYYKRHPLNLNYAGESELKELRLLSDPQIENFLQYRQLIGKLISIYELQAIPQWDIALIKKLLPYITISINYDITSIGKRFIGGDNSLLLRYGRIVEQAKGFKPPSREGSSHYLGSRDKLFLRYKYNYNNMLQYGFLGAKDAGEEFFKGSQKNGFYFYSFHLFARNIGILKQLAIGDFTVNMGQGLIQWQSLAFGKSAGILNVKRDAAILRPYNSSGSYNFHRGVGATIEKKCWSFTAFVSNRKLSGNIMPDGEDDVRISSFQTSGYHRTEAELADKNSIKQFATGASVKYKKHNWHVAVNTVNYNFSKSFLKEDKPYNLYALSGKSWMNSGVDYSYTYRNMHLFGEFAVDKNWNNAFVNGLLVSMGTKADMAIVHRFISKAYQSLYGNAFTENTYPNNERGLYTGVSIRPSPLICFDAYADVFSFPWLKYLVDAPSGGKDFLVRFTYTPNKKVAAYISYRSKTKQKSFLENNSSTKQLELLPQNNLRLHTTIQLNGMWQMSNRAEALWYDNAGPHKEQGFLMYTQADYKARGKFTGNMRLQYFETNGYNSRIYAMESDMLYTYSIPVFFDKGFRYYINCRLNASTLFNGGNKKQYDIGFWLKWSQTIYNDKNVIGSGLDAIDGNKRSEIKAQVIATF